MGEFVMRYGVGLPYIAFRAFLDKRPLAMCVYLILFTLRFRDACISCCVRGTGKEPMQSNGKIMPTEDRFATRK